MEREQEPGGCSQCERCIHQARRYRGDAGGIVYLRCAHPDIESALAGDRIEAIQAERLQRDCLEDALQQRCVLFEQFQPIEGCYLAEDLIPPVPGPLVFDDIRMPDKVSCEAHETVASSDTPRPLVLAPRL